MCRRDAAGQLAQIRNARGDEDRRHLRDRRQPDPEQTTGHASAEDEVHQPAERVRADDEAAEDLRAEPQLIARPGREAACRRRSTRTRRTESSRRGASSYGRFRPRREVERVEHDEHVQQAGDDEERVAVLVGHGDDVALAERPPRRRAGAARPATHCAAAPRNTSGSAMSNGKQLGRRTPDRSRTSSSARRRRRRPCAPARRHVPAPGTSHGERARTGDQRVGRGLGGGARRFAVLEGWDGGEDMPGQFTRCSPFAGRGANQHERDHRAERQRRQRAQRDSTPARGPSHSTASVIAVGTAASASHVSDAAPPPAGDARRAATSAPNGAARYRPLQRAADRPLHAGGMKRSLGPLMADREAAA